MIEITEKDADFILERLRKELTDVKDAERECVAHFVKAGIPYDLGKLEETTKRLSEPLIKMIRILTIGSEKTE